MRYQACNVQFVKSKAKLLKRYLSDPIMETCNPALTEVHCLLASGLGYDTWSELLIHADERVGLGVDTVPNEVFSQLTTALSVKISRSPTLCAALIYRLGFCPDNLDICLSQERLTQSDIALLVDIILDRLVEVESVPSAMEAGIFCLSAMHHQLHGDMKRKIDANGNMLPSEFRTTMVLMDWIGSICSIFAPSPQVVLQPLRKAVSEIKRLPLDRLAAPMEDGLIPKTGLLVMTGGFGSGRTLSSVLLTIRSRKNFRVRFPLFLQLFSGTRTNCASPGYIGEVRNMEDFESIIEGAKRQLVIVQLAAGSPGSAFSRTRTALLYHLGTETDQWMSDHFIGGYHHDGEYDASKAGKTDSVVRFWQAKSAQTTSQQQRDYVTFSDTRRL